MIKELRILGRRRTQLKDNLSPLNAELNPICHLLALLGAHHILHVSRIRVKEESERASPTFTSLKNSPWKTLWTCHNIDYVMNETKDDYVNESRRNHFQDKQCLQNSSQKNCKEEIQAYGT